METPEVRAKRVGIEVRNYVRDRFTPGDLSSLDDLAAFVETRVRDAAIDLRGTFMCRTCTRLVQVKHVNCTECSMVGR